MQNKSSQVIELKVEGMSCTNCSLGIKKALEKQGFTGVDADFTTDDVRFETNNESNLSQAVKTIESLGYKVAFRKEDSLDDKPEKKGLSSIEKKFWFTAVFTVPLILAMFIPIDLLHNDYFQLALTIPVFAVGFWHFGKSALNSLRAGVTNMDVLIFMGTTAAFIYSLVGTVYRLGPDYLFYETSASIISIVLLGNMLEHRSVKKTTSAIDELTRLQKTTAKRITQEMNEGQEYVEEIDASLVNTGDYVLINTGDKIPVDGEIYWGYGSIDESMVSGESVPVDRTKGDKVIGGTILEKGTIKVRTTATGKDTVLSQIIKMVRNAQKDKPRLHNLADKISAVFVPTVVVIAVLTLLGWYFLGDLPFRDSLMRGVAVLVIACPCALGLAIPTAVVVGLGRTAKNGILIKGGSVFDKFPKIEKVIFDKTGTLTTGRFRVKDLKAMGGKTQQSLVALLYSIEKHSSHPIAKSIVREFKGAEPVLFAKVEEERGIGLTAWDKQGNVYQAGSYDTVRALTSDNTHSIYITMNNKLIGWVDIEDEVKPEAKEAIDYLKKQGITPVLLSGDREKNCLEIAAKLGIEEVYFEKRPDEKLQIIEEISKNYKVAMVGDGINDAPALAKAYVGISMSDATQVAVKSAEVVLLKGNLSLLSKTFASARVTQRTIKENLFWAFIYNVMAIPLAIVGLLSPMIAAAAMALSDVIVVLNSLRLKKRRLPL
ncbi:MAG: cadmium-translocating P-type ATPase [Bacteroidetes bacterium]|nr:MAG: cadmium-translocating P-type ATPase [Bacteroidota bacterium]